MPNGSRRKSDPHNLSWFWLSLKAISKPFLTTWMYFMLSNLFRRRSRTMCEFGSFHPQLLSAVICGLRAIRVFERCLSQAAESLSRSFAAKALILSTWRLVKSLAPVMPITSISNNSSNSSSEEDKISILLKSNVNQRLSFASFRSDPRWNPSSFRHSAIRRVPLPPIPPITTGLLYWRQR